MQVIKVSRFGDPEVLQVGEADLPRPRPGEVLVRVLAAGVGPWDAWLRRGGYTGSLPYVPGGEFAGVVEGDTGDEGGLHDGAEVYGYPGLTGNGTGTRPTAVPPFRAPARSRSGPT